MTIFAVIEQPGQDFGKIPSRIAASFPTDFLPIASGVYLVSFAGTAQQLSDALGITNGETGAGLVLGVSTYFGKANPAYWEWMKTKWDAKSG